MMATKTVRPEWLPFAVLGVFGLTFLVGCGGGVRRVPVAGKVTLEGKPVNGGILSFIPDAAKGNSANINCTSPVKEGRYSLETIGITRGDSGPGVPLGWYKVTFNVLDLRTKKKKHALVEYNDKYRKAETTPWLVEVKDNPEPGAYDFKMTK
jgi:hypothetical protein